MKHHVDIIWPKIHAAGLKQTSRCAGKAIARWFSVFKLNSSSSSIVERYFIQKEIKSGGKLQTTGSLQEHGNPVNTVNLNQEGKAPPSSASHQLIYMTIQ